MNPEQLFNPLDVFVDRHIGPSEADVTDMMETVGVETLDALCDETVPAGIRLERELDLGGAPGEHELLSELRVIARKNRVAKSYIGMGYYGCITPAVIQRNILENPGWYTQYTPYQAEIAQGRLEALINFQTMVSDLTALPLANASLLDEATAAAEAMAMCRAVGRGKKTGFFVASDCHPQTIAVVKGRAKPVGIDVTVGSVDEIDFDSLNLAGVLLQFPSTDGRVFDYTRLVERAHTAGALVVVAADLLALTLLKAPGEFGADIAVGSTQRFGVPMGFGGPHAAYLATSDKYKRQMPGRIIGVSIDATGRKAYRMALQTREQHIRRDRATSNICTAQVLLAIMAGMYGVYHGPEGLRRIASRIKGITHTLANGLTRLGAEVVGGERFDTVRFRPKEGSEAVVARGYAAGINLRQFADGSLGASLDETTDRRDLEAILEVVNGGDLGFGADELLAGSASGFTSGLARTSDYLTHEVFHSYRSEHELLRYINRLQSRDLSLATSMIALGSCTMKLNGTTEMLPVTWPEFGNLHPFAPSEQTAGYREVFSTLEAYLAEITGFAAISLQPNAGSQGELAGLLVIRAHHDSNDQAHRNVCLIPASAHGTNAASAVMAGFKVVAVKCDEAGNIEVADLEAKARDYSDDLAALMLTYPSTHGVFEEEVRRICDLVHEYGGQVYMDGANMNAQVGLCRPGDIGADVCHLNLHKTFCIPHGGGGPGVGPIGVAKHLVRYLPGHPVVDGVGGEDAIAPVSAAPYGSPSILPISWVYIRLMGARGLKRATQIAILSANYMATRLASAYDVLYRGQRGRVAHEFIIDLRPFKATAGIEVDDVAKRLMDYGFHAPTMSFPVPGTMMIEPTESESKGELDRFCEAMLAIREEIAAIEDGRSDRLDNALKNAPHTAEVVSSDGWDRGYSREQAAFPVARLREFKFWPAVSRIDNAHGDRHLICTCPPLEELAEV